MDEQPAGIQARLDALAARLDAIGARIEQGSGRSEPKTFVERYGVLISAGVSLLIFVLGFLLRDLVDLALRERQVELATAAAVQDLVLQLAAPGADENRLAAAVALAGFGEPAIPPLVRQLRLRFESNRAAGREGLRTVALEHRARTCAAIGRVVGEQRRDYPAWSHEAAAGLLGELRCANALPQLKELRRLMADDEGRIHDHYRSGFQHGDRVLESDLRAALEAVDRAIADLEADQ